MPEQTQVVPHQWELNYWAYSLKAATVQNGLLLQLQIFLVIIIFLLTALLILTAVKR